MEYHADDLFKTIANLGHRFDLHFYPPDEERPYGLWRAALYTPDFHVTGEGTSHEYAVRECLQKYALRHGGYIV
jgi:hypothetical protein